MRATDFFLIGQIGRNDAAANGVVAPVDGSSEVGGSAVGNAVGENGQKLVGKWRERKGDEVGGLRGNGRVTKDKGIFLLVVRRQRQTKLLIRIPLRIIADSEIQSYWADVVCHRLHKKLNLALRVGHIVSQRFKYAVTDIIGRVGGGIERGLVSEFRKPIQCLAIQTDRIQNIS